MVDIIAPPRQLTASCGGCGARLGYTQPEVKSKTTSDYTGCKDTYHYIKCPGCQSDVTVPGYLPR